MGDQIIFLPYIQEKKKKFNVPISLLAKDNSRAKQLFGEDKIDMLNHHDEGSKVEVSFNLSSREYNGRYFHNIDAWRIESIEKSEEKSEDIPEFNSSADDEDDLPF